MQTSPHTHENTLLKVIIGIMLCFENELENEPSVLESPFPV